MKENIIPTINVNEIVKDGVYMTHTKDLVQIRGIDKNKNELYLYNITECCNMYMSLQKHRLIKRIR